RLVSRTPDRSSSGIPTSCPLSMLAGGGLLLAHRNGNPVEIAAIVVWQVADTAKATYAVDNYQDFVRVQAESALRHVATTHPCDALSRLAQNDVVELDEERK